MAKQSNGISLYLAPTFKRDPTFVSSEIDLLKHFKILEGKEYTPKSRKALSKSFLDNIRPGLVLPLKVCVI